MLVVPVCKRVSALKLGLLLLASGGTVQEVVKEYWLADRAVRESFREKSVRGRRKMVCWSGMGAAICKLSVKLSQQVKRRSSGKRGDTHEHTHHCSCTPVLTVRTCWMFCTLQRDCHSDV